MGVAHRRAHVAMAEQLLDGADAVAVLEQVGREGVAECVAVRPLCDAGPAASRAVARTARLRRIARRGVLIGLSLLPGAAMAASGRLS